MKGNYEQNKLKEYLGNSLYSTLKKYNCYIAGGFIRSLFTNNDINDVDIYFRKKEDLRNFLINEMDNKHMLFKTEKAITFRVDSKDVQCIYFKYFENANEIFRTFDYTVCMGAYDFKDEKFILHKYFLKHNAQRILMFNPNTAFPIISALRIEKYKAKGYSISKLEFLKVMLSINKLNISNYKELQQQIGGMYGENYSNLFDTNKKFSLEKALNFLSTVDMSKLKEKLYERNIDEVNFDEWELFVLAELGYKPKYFLYNEKHYVKAGNKIIEVDEYKDKYKKCKAENVIKFPIIKYKYVEKRNDRYFSFYDNSFEYKIGEKAIAKNSCGLFVTEKENLIYATYSDRDNKTILKCAIESFDDIKDITDFNQVKSLKVVEEIKEYKNEFKDSRISKTKM